MVLTVLNYTQDDLISELCTLSGILKEHDVLKMGLFLPSGESVQGSAVKNSSFYQTHVSRCLSLEDGKRSSFQNNVVF
jgi:hypothetical protein